MGCDIHVFVEYKSKDPNGWPKEWNNFGSDFFVSRNYDMFGRLAGVRSTGPTIDCKPLPDDLAWRTKEEYYYHLVDDPDDAKHEEGYHAVFRETGVKWVADGYSKFHPTDKNMVSGPDWHNAHCVDLVNWRKATHKKSEGNFKCDAIYAACKEMEKQGYETRIVFWFDN